MMKYQTGDMVILPDATFKPLCSAKIIDVNSSTLLYGVEIKYPGKENTETIRVTQERPTVMANPGQKQQYGFSSCSYCENAFLNVHTAFQYWEMLPAIVTAEGQYCFALSSRQE